MKSTIRSSPSPVFRLVKTKGRSPRIRRAFERRLSLADHIKVVGASLANGMLHVDLVHEVPEEAKPRKIAIGIGQAEQPQVVEKKAA